MTFSNNHREEHDNDRKNEATSSMYKPNFNHSFVIQNFHHMLITISDWQSVTPALPFFPFPIWTLTASTPVSISGL
jgi:hypothetical protein